MRDLFPGFYRPTREEFELLWKHGIVSVDSNMLLHIYRYSDTLRETLFKILECVGERLWIPHRVAYEFSKNRLKVIASQEATYDKVSAVLDKVSKIIQAEIPSRHPVIDSEKFRTEFTSLIKSQQSSVANQKDSHPKVPDDDPFLARLEGLLRGKIGSPYSADKNDGLIEEGERRYKAKIPPGYRDEKKDDDPLHKFGDFVVWRQLLDQAKYLKAPYVIFATDDNKDDWWWQEDGKTLGPHPSLVEEAMRDANTRVYFYQGNQFIKYGSLQFGLDANEDLINEARTIRQEIGSLTASNKVSLHQIMYAIHHFNPNIGPNMGWDKLRLVAGRIRNTTYSDSIRNHADSNFLPSLGLPPSNVVLELAGKVPRSVASNLIKSFSALDAVVSAEPQASDIDS